MRFFHRALAVSSEATVVRDDMLLDQSFQLASFSEHPGTWMFHCHIREHAERGMIGELDVTQP